MLGDAISKNGWNPPLNLKTFFDDWPEGRNFLSTFIKSREDPNEAAYRLRYLAFHDPTAPTADVQAAREVILKLVTRPDVALQAALLVTTLPYALIKAMAALRVTDQAG
jgi:hypothetical protein